jgi:hypothetical protein
MQLRCSARMPALWARGFSAAATRPWNVARQLLEAEKAEEAHELLSEEMQKELKDFQTKRSWAVPLMLLELSKTFLKLSEAQDALTALEHCVTLFEEGFAESLAEDDSAEIHGRYVEALLHLAKLLFVSGQGNPEHMWKKAISHAMKHEGRDSYHTLVATVGLAEFSLEQLRLEDADRFSAAAAELARQLQPTRAVRERLVEAVAMQGLSRVQRQDTDGGMRFFLQAMSEIEAIEVAAGGLDAWTRSAYHNLYRNIDHVFKTTSEDDKARGTSVAFILSWVALINWCRQNGKRSATPSWAILRRSSSTLPRTKNKACSTFDCVWPRLEHVFAAHHSHHHDSAVVALARGHQRLGQRHKLALQLVRPDGQRSVFPALGNAKRAQLLSLELPCRALQHSLQLNHCPRSLVPHANWNLDRQHRTAPRRQSENVGLEGFGHDLAGSREDGHGDVDQGGGVARGRARKGRAGRCVGPRL